jgi:hypothetical protein
VLNGIYNATVTQAIFTLAIFANFLSNIGEAEILPGDEI